MQVGAFGPIPHQEQVVPELNTIYVILLYYFLGYAIHQIISFFLPQIKFRAVFLRKLVIE